MGQPARARQDFEPPAEFDDYLIVQELGRGQMGRVYLATDAVLARSVAIKFIAGVEPDLAARQRFLMEARAAARIQHPNVLSIYRVGELGDRPFIVSELVRGKSLVDVPRPMAWDQLLPIAIELARGLAAAHRKGVVHCDLKPGNAMVTEDGVAKLVDFGLARVVHDGSDDDEGPMVGTPDYMAPEVWAGRSPSRRSDVYSFGAMLYELVSGATPHADVLAADLPHVIQERAPRELHDRVPEVDVRFSRLVSRCLEIDPERRFPSGEELREALEQIHPSRAHAIRADENPYRGLRTFEASHRGLFFGRGLEIGAIVERLRTDSIVIVTGDSGVGKSSLLRAGVVPAVVDGALGGGRSWQTLTMLPGRRPLAALAAALGDPGITARVLADPETLPRELHRRAGDGGLLLFVDQMEELVTVGDPDEVAALDAGLALISEGMASVRLVTTVRADFLSRIATLPRLGRELSRLLYFVSPLPPERIRDVITGPASVTGVQFESEAMIGALVEATAQAGSGGLPLLSFALAELWEARDRDKRTITTTALDTMGGVAGALARHGDAVLAGMPAADRVHARRVLLRLVTSVGTRVRRTESELSVGEGTRVALDALVKGRLLVVHDGDDGATYELAHEVLVRGWGTLREWLDADADDRARRERVAAAAAEWQRVGKRSDLTWRGPRLVEAKRLELAALTALERDFIHASVRTVRRRTWLARLSAAGVIGLVVLAFWIQRRIAHDRLTEAVDADVAAARGVLETARAADAKQRELATQAFAKFDAGDTAAGEQLWTQVLAARATAEKAYRSAGGSVETALGKDPSRDDVRALLGDILLDRALLADTLRANDRRDELAARLVAYDVDGSRRARFDAPARLVVDAPADADLVLEPSGRVLGRGHVETREPPGSYVVVARAPGREPVRYPVMLARGRSARVALELPAASTIPQGYVYIPPSTFLYGSKADEEVRLGFLTAVPLHERASTQGYVIGQTEITIADWLEFVAAQPADAQAKLLPALPTKVSGGLILERDPETGWRIVYQPTDRVLTARWGEPLVYPGRTQHARQDWRRFPITGISAGDVEAYAAWLDRTGRLPGARLCTELEWEHAARGADGRAYPAGEQLADDDANIDATYRPYMGLDAVGSHARAVGPFGLVDMSGNAFEWTRAESGSEYVVRGGSYWNDRKTANLANRATMAPTMRDAVLGARLCASSPIGMRTPTVSRRTNP
ncbi:MAG TPA: bifunctional serine/threonine-protein kinase/formylglycine-generating enzyme family protein [Kofleriaceae bacterium]|nr:bifunctional serine/threonine-protein kinase/formylglycine-generating enzyme family protein [Kofleriaceae bacterium]